MEVNPETPATIEDTTETTIMADLATNQRNGSTMGRRALLTGAAALAGAATLAPRLSRAQEQRDYGPDATPVHYPDQNVVAVTPDFNQYIVGNSAIQRLWTGGLWLEGPAWNAVGRYLLWSDIPNDVQHRWLEEDGHVSTFRVPSGNSNGNTFDWEGRQVSCQHGNREVVRYEHNGTMSVLADLYEGKPFNSPNDAVVHPNGSIWFTDPPYGTANPGGYEGNFGEINHPNAVYRIDTTGKVERVTDELEAPNGLCFSPDYTLLYIVDTGGEQRDIKVFDVVDEKTLRNPRRFAQIEVDGEIVAPTPSARTSMATSGPAAAGSASGTTGSTPSRPRASAWATSCCPKPPPTSSSAAPSGTA
jgi:gluconolactonase